MRTPDEVRAELDGGSNLTVFVPNGRLPALGPPPLRAMDWAKLHGLDPPWRSFVVPEWLPRGVVTSLYGTGGVGKSLLAQLLGTATAAGLPFLGLRTARTPVVALFGEDDGNELWRRQHRINSWYGIGMLELADFAAHGRLGMENRLMTFSKGQPPQPLPLLADIESAARTGGAGLVILDNVAQMFGGEENCRSEVTAFVNALNGLACRLDAAVLLLGHPPKNGADYSGSTAWHAAVRCMWTLARPVEQGNEGEPSEALLLTRAKANYAAAGEEIRLRWVDGVLRREDGEAAGSAIDAMFRAEAACTAFLTALDELTSQRRSVSHSDRAGNFAPKFMQAAGLAGGFSAPELKRAMNKLFADRRIVASAELWRGPDRKVVLGIARAASAAQLVDTAE